MKMPSDILKQFKDQKSIKENFLERVLRSAMERLGWGGDVGERGPGSLGPCVSKQGRARLTQTGGLFEI